MKVKVETETVGMWKKSKNSPVLKLLLIGIICELPISPTEGQPRVKRWGMNTNFGNPANWEGYIGDCSQNIFSFPMSMDMTVISLPSNSTLRGKQIILPRNGRLVFQSGPTTLFNSPADTCQGTELRFRRTSRADWYDPDNWIPRDEDSLLNVRAIGHCERVPCQYDSAQFPSSTTFNLFISSDVFLHKFLLGEEELTYTDVASLMGFGLGKIQFLKNPETSFKLETAEWEDSDQFICRNYLPEIKRKICTLADCPTGRGGPFPEDCPKPLVPPGFCCPICAFHLKIQHRGGLRLSPVRGKLKTLVESLNLGPGRGLMVHVGRNAPKQAHIVFIPWMNKTGDVIKLIDQLRSFLRIDPENVALDQEDSWEGIWDTPDSLTSGGGVPGGVIFLLVFLTIAIIGGIIALIWKRAGRGGEPLTFNNVLSRMANIVPTTGLGSQRPSFAFARFSNERVSSINIGQMSGGGIERTDKVDTDTNPIEIDVPTASTDGNSGIGFANVVYDIIGGSGTSDGKDGQTAAGASGQTVKLDKESSMATKANYPRKEPKDNDENVYDLVDVNGGRNGSNSGPSVIMSMSDLKPSPAKEE